MDELLAELEGDRGVIAVVVQPVRGPDDHRPAPRRADGEALYRGALRSARRAGAHMPRLDPPARTRLGSLNPSRAARGGQRVAGPRTPISRSHLLCVLRQVTFLTEGEVRRVEHLLSEIDVNDDSVIVGEELRLLPALVFNPLVDRILRVFDADGSGNLSLDELLDLYSVFSHRATTRAKAQIMFCIYGEKYKQSRKSRSHFLIGCL